MRSLRREWPIVHGAGKVQPSGSLSGQQRLEEGQDSRPVQDYQESEAKYRRLLEIAKTEHSDV